MKARLQYDDSFEEEEKDSDKPKEKSPILNGEQNEINILKIKTTQTVECKDNNNCRNYHDRIAEMTKNILSRLIKISIVLSIFTGIEFIGSYFSNSIGVLTICAILLTDLIKFIITIISIIIIQNPANEIMTYGY